MARRTSEGDMSASRQSAGHACRVDVPRDCKSRDSTNPFRSPVICACVAANCRCGCEQISASPKKSAAGPGRSVEIRNARAPARELRVTRVGLTRNLSATRPPRLAYAQRDSGLTEMKGDFLLKSLERDPRYIAFLKKMRLPV